MKTLSFTIINAKDNIQLTSRFKKGWNGYNAYPPNQRARNNAIRLINTFQCSCSLHRAGASVVGGIGISFCRDNREAYVEFYNNGLIFAMFSDNTRNEPPSVITIENGTFPTLYREIKTFLRVQTR